MNQEEILLVRWGVPERIGVIPEAPQEVREQDPLGIILPVRWEDPAAVKAVHRLNKNPIRKSI